MIDLAESTPRMPSGSFYHFSVDDVLYSLLQAASPDRLGADPLFDFLARIHGDHGTQTDLYLFLQDEGRALTHVTSGLLNEFVRLNKVRLGPHALNYTTPPYAQSASELEQDFAAIYREISRIAGDHCCSEWLRLHYFSECYESASFLKDHQVTGLLLTDKPALCYRLPEGCRSEVSAEGYTRYSDLLFIRSHLRIENLATQKIRGDALKNLLERMLETHGFLVIFSHEVDLMKPEVRATAEACLAHLSALGVPSI